MNSTLVELYSYPIYPSDIRKRNTAHIRSMNSELYNFRSPKSHFGIVLNREIFELERVLPSTNRFLAKIGPQVLASRSIELQTTCVTKTHIGFGPGSSPVLF
jgi:hypothetical protein